MMGEQALPEGWVWTRIGEIYNIVGGGTPSTDNQEYWAGDIPWVTSADIHGWKNIQPRKQVSRSAIENSATNVVPSKSLLVATRVGLGKVALAEMPLCFSQDIQALVGNESIIFPDYLLYYLAQAAQIFKYQNRGTTIAGITKKQLADLYFAFPPLPEQQRIVEAIEQQFSRLDEAVALLRRAQKRLKLYRASVLKAAVEGRLTAAWRASQADLEPAPVLLQRILTERRAKWEEEQAAKGRDPMKAKYEEPAGPDVHGLAKLPEGWCWATVEQVASFEPRSIQSGPFGSALLHSEFQDSGILAIGIDNVLNGTFSNGSQHRISPHKYEELKKFTARSLDVLITVMGTVGRCCVVPPNLETAIITKHVYRISVNQTIVNPYFLMHCLLGAPDVLYQLFGKIQGQTRPGINGEILKKICIPIPPLAEQAQIVSLLEERLSIISELEASIEKGLKRAGRQRQSILRKAFSGRLVPQNPADEPASVLLERIRQEREQARQSSQSVAKASRTAAPRRSRQQASSGQEQSWLPNMPPVEPIDPGSLVQDSLWIEETGPEDATQADDSERQDSHTDEERQPASIPYSQQK